MSLHKVGTNTGATEWDSFSKAWREPGRKRQASGSGALLKHCQHVVLLYSRDVFSICPQRDLAARSPAPPFLSSPSVLARRTDEWMEGSRLPVSHASARSVVSLQAQVVRIHLPRLRKELVPKCFLWACLAMWWQKVSYVTGTQGVIGTERSEVREVRFCFALLLSNP